MQNIIFSKMSNSYIPVRVKKNCYGTDDICPQIVEYNVYHNRKKIGFVRLRDVEEGCYVQYIKNERPNEYGNFGYLADILEVQHCMQRGLEDFEIISYADFNSHAMHFLRGKRFVGKAGATQRKRFKELFKDVKLKSYNINDVVQYIIEHTPKGEIFNTRFLKQVSMYMPKELIKRYISELRKSPIKIV